MPKQLLPLAGSAEEPLIAATVRRIEPLVPAERVWISTGTSLVDATVAALPGVPRSHFIAEPVARNTAPCIGWAAATIAREDPDAIVAILPADHFIGNEPAFRDAIGTACRAAEHGWIATVGIVPTRPETGYGYIEVGDSLDEVGRGVRAVTRFVEKPTRERAEAFLADGRYLWNGGMFFFRAGVMLAAIQEHLPALGAGLDKIDEAARSGSANEARVVAEVFPTVPSISIDHGVMEKAKKIAVVPGDFGWNDVGSWQVTWEMSAKDGAGNALPQGTVVVDAKNNLVRDLTTGAARKDPKRWALIGVDDLVIVETDDAVLVVPRDRAQDVRAVVEELAKRGEKDKV
jgi:mannose-1-phosphate guanylyltransferase